MKKEIELVEDSEYIIRSLGSKDEPIVTKGKFIGYSSIGEEGGMCIKMNSSHGELEGKIRIIPLSMILSIDIMKAAKVKKKEEETARYLR
jgi:hypothetical protein